MCQAVVFLLMHRVYMCCECPSKRLLVQLHPPMSQYAEDTINAHSKQFSHVYMSVYQNNSNSRNRSSPTPTYDNSNS